MLAHRDGPSDGGRLCADNDHLAGATARMVPPGGAADAAQQAQGGAADAAQQAPGRPCATEAR